MIRVTFCHVRACFPECGAVQWPSGKTQFPVCSVVQRLSVKSVIPSAKYPNAAASPGVISEGGIFYLTGGGRRAIIALLISNTKYSLRGDSLESKYVQQFKKGSLEMVLLCLIARRETYGYEIITQLNERGASVWGYAREGTVYPILYRLQDAGLIACRLAPSASNGGSKKYYSVTERGREALGELTAFWESYVKCVDGFIRDAREVEQ